MTSFKKYNIHDKKINLKNFGTAVFYLHTPTAQKNSNKLGLNIWRTEALPPAVLVYYV